MPTSIKLDPRLKKALEKLAQKRGGIAVASLIKQAIAKFLEDEGINWLDESNEEPKKKSKK